MDPAVAERNVNVQQPLRVLIVENSRPDADLILNQLEKAGFKVSADLVETAEEFSLRLGANTYDIILADYRLPNWTGMDALKLLRHLGQDIPFVLVTGTLGEEAAVECIKEGVSDYVLKERLARLPVAVRRALEEKALREDRARAAQALRESEARYRILAETANDAFITINSESRILFVNAAAERIFGYTRAEMLGQSLTLLMPENLREVHRAGLKRYLETGRRHIDWESAELTGLHKSGTEITLGISFAEFVIHGERTFTGIIRDITERKRAREKLQQANEELMVRVSELQQRTRETTLVNEMGELLQTCLNPDEAYAVIGKSAEKLFPTEPGTLYLLNASRNLLEPAVVWGDSPPEAEAVVFAPEDCWALRRGRMHWVEDSQSGLLCQHLSRSPSASYLCVPMMALGQALGVLFLQSPPKPNQPERPLGLVQESKQRLALTVAEHTALALANLKLRENLRTQSIRDPLTGLFNRRYMEESLERELHRLARRRRGLGLIMLDLDHFKSFNDSLGHEAGDTLLRELGHFLQSRTRQEDIACRYGGEEFTLILPEASLEVTRQRAERLREDVKQLNVQYLGQILPPVTLSQGVVAFPEHGWTATTLLRAADAALYLAKGEGRDRVVVGQAVEEEAPAPPPHVFAAYPPGQPK